MACKLAFYVYGPFPIANVISNYGEEKMICLINKRSPSRLWVVILTAWISLLAMVGVCVACDPGYPIVILNDTNENLTINQDGNFIGEIAPGVEIESMFLFTAAIRVTNSQEQIVFDKVYSHNDLRYREKTIIASPDRK